MKHDRQQESRFSDLARACSHSGEPRFTRFLEPPELHLAAHAANEAGVKYAAFGGYEDAERQMAAFTPDGEVEESLWPILCLKISWNPKYGDIGHRDLLGALMAQGIERACTGDIALGSGCAYLFTVPEVAPFLIANMDSAGRARLKLSEVGLDEAALEPQQGVAARVTVASMRLDALLSEGLNLSRAQAQNLISRGLVKLNHIEQLRTDAKVASGDLISARGYGRIRVGEPQQTKKGRIGIQLLKYGK